jgi:CheY-like chemotaxis protein
MMRKILVVDDEQKLVELLKIRLEANQYEVVTAFNGTEALEKVGQENPSLIILDVIMPGMDGGEFAKNLMADVKTSWIPIIFLTSLVNKGEESAEQYKINVEHKHYQTLAKPFDSSNLLKMIKDLIG